MSAPLTQPLHPIKDVMAGNAQHPASQALCPPDSEFRAIQDLFFFLFRDLNSQPDSILLEFGYGRAHHRCLHWINRRPGLTVGELLSILGITKQSLTRVLGPLVREGYVLQTPGHADRRQRLLTLTPAGIALEQRLFDSQKERIALAYSKAGDHAMAGFLHVVHELISPQGHHCLSQSAIPRPDETSPVDQS